MVPGFPKIQGQICLYQSCSPTLCGSYALIYTEKFITLVGFVVPCCRVFIEVVSNESHYECEELMLLHVCVCVLERQIQGV